MDPKLEAIFDKARKLSELARRAGTAGEAQAAAGVLAKLIARHRLDTATLEAQRTPTGFVMEPAPIGMREALWKRMLLSLIASQHAVLMLKIKDKSSSRRVLAGRADDIALVRYFYAWVASEAARLGSNEPRKTRDSWYVAFVLGVRQQILAAQAETRGGSDDAHALTVIDGRAAAVIAALRANGSLRIRQISLGREEPADLDAHLRGYRAGTEVPLQTADGKRSLDS